MPQQKQQDDDRQRNAQQPEQDIRHFKPPEVVFTRGDFENARAASSLILKDKENDTGVLGRCQKI
ncbi:MAG: hypothetical protein KGH75_11590 [Rhodospirillales bacterium]|nr:hypothetical protein [Rhodospirillales bacterium]